MRCDMEMFVIRTWWLLNVLSTKSSEPSRVLEHSAVTTQTNDSAVAARQGIRSCFAYNLLSTSLVILSNQALPLADHPLMPSSPCDSCQSYIVNLTNHWTLHSWTLSLLSTPSVTPMSGKHFAAKNAWHHTPSAHCSSCKHRCTHQG